MPCLYCRRFIFLFFPFLSSPEQNIGELLNQDTSDLQQKLCQIGDSIVYKLVQWTRRLPFYDELPVDVHTRLLTHKWHELLVLTTSAYQAIHGCRRLGTSRSDGKKPELHQEVKKTQRQFEKSYDQCLQLLFPLHFVSGCYQSCNAPDLSDLNDGEANHHGPASRRCRPHGGEDHQGHCALQSL